VGKGAYIEYHVCGDLTLSGAGYLTGLAPGIDSVIVVENGGIDVADDSVVSTMRVAFVLTGSNAFASSVSFPNGKGKGSTLALSPATSAGNPWRGISLYQDPELTKSIDNDWGGGATLIPDGVVYLPKSNITLSGNATSNINNCTKVVANTIRINGAVSVQFGQSTAGCAKLGVAQWSETSVFLSQ